MTLTKESTVYEHSERICNAIRGKRNLTSQDTATIVLLSVLDEVLNSGKTVEQLLARDGDEGVSEENAAKATAWRKATRDMIKPFMTAANNAQNSIMACTPRSDDATQMLLAKNTAEKVNLDDMV